MAHEPEPPKKSALSQILSEAGWVGLVLSGLLGQLGLSALIGAIVEPPQADIGTVKVMMSVFLVTAPLTIALAIFAGAAFTGSVRGGPPLLAFLALCLVVGMLVGNGIGGAVLTPEEAAAVVDEAGLQSGVAQILARYHAAYGGATFLASAVLGGALGRWAKLLSDETS